MMINSNSEHANGIFTYEVQFDFIISLGVFFLCFKLKTKAINSTM